MARPRMPQRPVHLVSARMLDVISGELVEPGDLLVEARVIKVSASGGVMSHTGPAGDRQYSTEELEAIVDEAHGAGLKVAAHCHGDEAIRVAVESGIDCIEHGSLMSDETMHIFHRARDVPRGHHIPG